VFAIGFISCYSIVDICVGCILLIAAQSALLRFGGLNMDKVHEKRAWSYLNTGTIIRFVVSILFCALYLMLKYIFTVNLEIADALSEVAKVVELILSGAMSYIQFAVAEVLLYALITVFFIYLVYIVFKSISTGRWFVYPFRMLSNICLFLSSLLLIFMMLFGVQYHSTSLANHMDLNTRARSLDELTEVTEYVLVQANAFSSSVLRDENGDCNYGSFQLMSSWIASGYEKLSDEYPFFKSSYAPVKSVQSSKFMSRVGVAGIYIPFTGETLVNPETPAPGIVFNMSHEIAHRLGVAAEDEANFAAYMACKSHTDRRVKYAGYFMAFRYLFNALYAQDPDMGNKLWEMMTPELAHDMDQLNEYIESYESPVRDFGNSVNDTYLKANGQSSGLKSYGQMVDLVMAEYFAAKEAE